MIDVRVFTDEEHARKWERDENMARVHLSKHERDRQLARWVHAAEKAAKQSPAQNGPVKSRREDGRGGSVGTGINAAARKLGVPRSTLQRALKATEQAGETPSAPAPAPVPEPPKVQRPQAVPDAPDYGG